MEPWIPVKPYQTSMMVFLSKNSFFKKKQKKKTPVLNTPLDPLYS